MAEIPLAPVERIMRRTGMSKGVDRVSERAVEDLRNELESLAVELSTKAAVFAKHAGRKTITPEDVKLAGEQK
ncbi:MAG: histone family protein [Candidatus Altiarchaeota archaeon]|nr:histone family protein [Candidatus Altiarchaeota archaeon]